ncbi:serine O-acetyltransferase [Paenibacillus wynnii]|uniref:serine O-acetyltransferase n=1 Tax=Paenibacillus wynnii TaxID=268407 RepID=UPI0027912C7E|nr:serine acetyltransferase [Paenibacillus wynnii]MDQ0193692.1 serine O-acetyltransferase [Paenibacillus wynnii]
MIRSFKTDLKANRKNPQTIMVLFTYRFGNWVHYQLKSKVVKKPLWMLYKLMDLAFVRILSNGELHAQAKIGDALHLPHGLNGIIISHKAVIGRNATIFHQVTIGGRNSLGEPVIGDRAFIGVGSKILGPVFIGDDVNIGAMSVVVKDVPNNASAVGIPARNLLRDEPKQANTR